MTRMRAGWFPVYARDLRNHSKFRGLTHAELGAWCDLRGEVEMLSDVAIADRAEAIHVLTRRSTAGQAGKMLDRLIAVRLIDELPDGGLWPHDLKEHSGRYPSDEPDATRDRQNKSRESRDVTTPSRAGHVLDEMRVDETKRDTPPPPAERGRRSDGTSPRAVGKNPRATGAAPRQNGESPRQERAAEKRGAPTLARDVLAEMAKGLER